MTQPSAERVVSGIRNWTQRTRPTDKAVVVTVPFLIGDGVAVLTTGIKAVLPIFFNARIISIAIQEFDGHTGSVTLDIGKFTGGLTPVIVSLIGTGGAVPTINTGRYYFDDVLGNWNTTIVDGEYISLAVSTISVFTRLSVALRLRRK
jgi:hypothetical protein